MSCNARCLLQSVRWRAGGRSASRLRRRKSAAVRRWAPGVRSRAASAAARTPRATSSSATRPCTRPAHRWIQSNMSVPIVIITMTLHHYIIPIHIKKSISIQSSYVTLNSNRHQFLVQENIAMRTYRFGRTFYLNQALPNYNSYTIDTFRLESKHPL